jgi:uncharacterized protein with HEPN domain
MSRDVSLYIKDILENMNDAESFLGSLSQDDFRRNKKTVNAVIRSIEIIGEAAKSVPSAMREKSPDIPWKDMAGMRDVCIHMYFGVNHRRVWEVVKEDIPRIKPLIVKLLNSIDNT